MIKHEEKALKITATRDLCDAESEQEISIIMSDEDGFHSFDFGGYVWTSDRKNAYFARALRFNDEDFNMCSYYRANGISIRPVINLR